MRLLWSVTQGQDHGMLLTFDKLQRPALNVRASSMRSVPHLHVSSCLLVMRLF